jgi:hypothetical protein
VRNPWSLVGFLPSGVSSLDALAWNLLENAQRLATYPVNEKKNTTKDP